MSWMVAGRATAAESLLVAVSLFSARGDLRATMGSQRRKRGVVLGHLLPSLIGNLSARPGIAPPSANALHRPHDDPGWKSIARHLDQVNPPWRSGGAGDPGRDLKGDQGHEHDADGRPSRGGFAAW